MFGRSRVSFAGSSRDSAAEDSSVRALIVSDATASPGVHESQEDCSPCRSKRARHKFDPIKVRQRLEAVLDRFEITIAEADDIQVLQDYEMVVIADDSGSMNNAAEQSHHRKMGEEKRTRWHELVDTVSEIVEIASCFDEDGIDIYFLNREPAIAVKHSNDVAFVQAFEKRPTGTTPLSERLQAVAKKCSEEEERPVIIFILTDGEPDGGEDKFRPVVRSVVDAGKTHIQIMACTSEEEEIGWLNRLDLGDRKVDVCDDYYSERREVLSVGLRKRFTRGDWCIKAMIGPISEKFDKWDEALGKRSTSICGCNCTLM